MLLSPQQALQAAWQQPLPPRATCALLFPHLGHLDLELVGVGEVVAGDPKAAAGNLLDGRALWVLGAVLERDQARGVLPSLSCTGGKVSEHAAEIGAQFPLWSGKQILPSVSASGVRAHRTS